MKKFLALVLSTCVTLSLAVTATAHSAVITAVKVTKPAAPTIAAISSSPVKKGKVNLTVSILLPVNTGGAKITGSKISVRGKSCSIKKTKTSCTIKGIKNGTTLSVRAQTKNKKGFGAKSVAVTYVAGSAAYPVAPTNPTVISNAAIAGLELPTPGGTPDNTVNSGVGYTADVAWSGALTSSGKFRTDPQYTATITLTTSAGYTLSGVAANFFTVTGASSVANAVSAGVVTAVFPGVVYSVGDIGPAGGVIFITPQSRLNGLGGDSYYEATVTDLAQRRWCTGPNSASVVGAAGTSIGAGKSNTAEIVGGTVGANCTGGAAVTANDYVSAGTSQYSDWFLPSKDELNQLCRYAKAEPLSADSCGGGLNTREGFPSLFQWSSSELDAIEAWQLSLSNGQWFTDVKEASEANVRPVRSFQ